MLRVLVLGDSFVQAAQVGLEEGFGRRLEHWLNMDESTPAEVLSLGVPGAGTATALHLWRQQGAALRPDVVVLGFLVANDVFNNHPELDSKRDKPFFALRGGDLVPIDPGDSPLGPLAKSSAWRKSHLVRWLGRRAAASFEARRRVAQGQGLPLDLRVHDPALPAPWPAAWETTGALAAVLANEVAAGGAALGVVLFPGPVSGSRAGQQRAQQRWPELSDWDMDRARRRAAEVLAPTAPVADLTGSLRAAERAGREPLYFVDDGHWTPAGHDTAAQAAAPAVRKWLSEAAAGG
jgi:lysophospholipase L1-like esterase